MSNPMPEATLDSPQEAPESSETDVEVLGEEKGQDEESEASETYSETFDREYVQGLRDQNAKLRVRSKKTDQMAQQLVTLLAEQTGRLHDPSDLGRLTADLVTIGCFSSFFQCVGGIYTYIATGGHGES